MNSKDLFPGITVICLIALLSYALSMVNESYDALVISIICSMFVGNMVRDKARFRGGAEAAMKFFLPSGIALYGSQLVFQGLRGDMIFIIFLVSLGLFVVTMVIASLFNINRKTSVLLASGLSICGASAIAVISPLIGAKKEDTSTALISVLMLGLTGMIFYPMLRDLFYLSSDEFAFLAGSTLPMLGQVKVAAGTAGAEIAAAAVGIKLVRISFLVFLATAAVYSSGIEERRVRVPWFAAVFIILSVLSASTGLIAAFVVKLKVISTFCLSAGLAAIGFFVEFESIIDDGVKPVGVLFLSWSVVVVAMYLVRNLF